MIFLAAAILSSNLALTPGCNFAGDDGATGMDSSVAELASGSYPAARELSTINGTTGAVFSGADVATNEEGLAFRAASSSPTATGLRLTGAPDEVCWALYAVAWNDVAAPDTLHLDLAARTGAGWLALADYQAGNWEWQQLPAGTDVDVYLRDGLGYHDGRLHFVLAAYGGESMVVDGGNVSVDGVVPEDPGPTPEPEPEPEPGPKPEPEPEPEPEPVVPAVNGAYISVGYWEADRVDATFAALADLGVNLVFDYALSLPEDDYWDAAFQHYLDTADANGVGIAYWLARPLEGMTPLTADGHFTACVAEVAQLKDQPAITAWYVHDEVLPMVSGVDGTSKYCLSLAQMQELYDLIKAEDPTRPQLSVWNWLPDFDGFSARINEEDTPYGSPDWMSDPVLYEQTLAAMIQDTTDWVLVDSYPVGAPWLGEDAEAPELAVAALVARAADLRSFDQPLAFVYQAFSWAQYTGTDGIPFPTRAELDGMLCAAKTYGADWAVAYSWFDLADDLPGRDVAGRDEAFANLQDVLACLGSEGWPVTELPTGTAEMVMPMDVEIAPVIYQH